MARVKYLGPYQAATTPGVGRVEKGGVYDVADELAAELVGRGPKSWAYAEGSEAPPEPEWIDDPPSDSDDVVSSGEDDSEEDN